MPEINKTRDQISEGEGWLQTWGFTSLCDRFSCALRCIIPHLFITLDYLRSLRMTSIPGMCSNMQVLLFDVVFCFDHFGTTNIEYTSCMSPTAVVYSPYWFDYYVHEPFRIYWWLVNFPLTKRDFSFALARFVISFQRVNAPSICTRMSSRYFLIISYIVVRFTKIGW